MSAPARDIVAPILPAALRLQEAAAYCGLCVDEFKKVCPVRPISFTQSTRGNRYLRVRLDEWLLSMDPNGSGERRFGDRAGGQSAA